MTKKEILALFGQNVKKYRTQNNLTQEKLAKQSNLSRSSIAQIEAGKIFVTADTLTTFCEIFECAPVDFFVQN